jgi:hypothetical protein
LGAARQSPRSGAIMDRIFAATALRTPQASLDEIDEFARE